IPGKLGPNCFYAPALRALPVKNGDFIGSVKEGGSVNSYNLFINPHGNGTHTECVGHINEAQTSLRSSLHKNFFCAHLISIYPQLMDSNDRCITCNGLEILLNDVDI